MSGTTAVHGLTAHLSNRVIRILGNNPGPMTLQGSNTYLVGCGPQRLLIDTGEGKPQYAAALQEVLAHETRKLGRTVQIESVLLTHWHGDHVGGVDAVRAISPDAKFFKIPSRSAPLPQLDPICAPPPTTLTVEGVSLTVVPTPGHTDDHFCVFLEEEKAMFTADSILGTGTSVFACYMDYMASLYTMRGYNPEKLYPAHGNVVVNGVERIDAILHHRQTREKQIIAALAEHQKLQYARGMSIEELVEIIYAATTPRHLWKAAGVNVLQHVKSLVCDGTATVTDLPHIMGVDVTSNSSDYELLGEGVKTDTAVMDTIFKEFRVALTMPPRSGYHVHSECE